MVASFTIYGEPFGKLNMQPVMRGKHAEAIQPKKNQSYMQMVRYAYIESCNGIRFGDEEPLEVFIRAYKPIPKSFSNKKVRLIKEGKIVPITKPDLDNISKIVLDSLTGLAWRDDAQVASEHIAKFYSDTPRVEIEITSLQLDD